MKKNSISVIIPLYNKADYVKRAIDSVLEQTYRCVEIIVVNDGSTDDPDKVLSSFNNSKITVLNQKNSGVSAARNAGLNASTSQYVAFLDADDYWMIDHLFTLNRLINESPTSGLYATQHIVKKYNSLNTEKIKPQHEILVTTNDFISYYLNDLSIVTSSTCCVNRSVILKTGGFPLNVLRGEDGITWIKISLLTNVTLTNRVTAIIDQDAINRSIKVKGRKSVPETLNYLTLLKHEIKFAEKDRINKLYKKIAFNTAAGYVLDLNRTGSFFIAQHALCARNFTAFFFAFMVSCAPRILLKLCWRLRQYAKNK